MKKMDGCRLFGAFQLLGGIRDASVLFHSVVGCNFGTLSCHVSKDQSDIRQCSTVISDDEVIFGGTEALEKAIRLLNERGKPAAIFVISGCVSEMIGDDIRSVVAKPLADCPVLHVAAPGFDGGSRDGYEEAAKSLLGLMEEPKERKNGRFRVNVLGPGMDDWQITAEKEAFRELLGPEVELGFFAGECTLEDVREAAQADLNLVFGRGRMLAKAMREKWGIPFEELDYPYGLTGADRLWKALERHLPVHYEQAFADMQRRTAKELEKVYCYLQAFYGRTAAIIGEKSRAAGMAEFLRQELGMEIEACIFREKDLDLENAFDQVRRTEPAVLFGSTYELELAEELGIPLIRFDYPVFDAVSLTRRPYIGEQGVLCLVEDLIHGVLRARYRKGALCQ
ncbi:MAG: nitrogenase component 1 [Eubacteriales bacterium]|nr:nitrogenase component 1 [Eubacteriales bacterium]